MILPGPPKNISSGEISLPDIITPEQKAKQLGADRFKLLAWPGWDLIQGHVMKVWGKPSSVVQTS